MRHANTLSTKSKTHTVDQISATAYHVTSGKTGNAYTVTMLENGAACTCDWAKYRPASNNGQCGCSHVIAVIAYRQAKQERTIKAHADEKSARRQHRQILDIGDGLLLTTRKA